VAVSPLAPTAMPPLATATAPSFPTATIPGTAAASANDRLYVLDPAGQGRYLVLDGSSGRVERTLPAGVPNTDWTLLYAVTAVGAQTRVDVIEVATGATLRSKTLDGELVLPRIASGNLVGGLSGNGYALILVATPSDEEIKAFERDNRWVSRFVVVDPTFGKPARTIALDGNYSYDTLAPSGRMLYLIEHRPAVHPTEEYSVRAYDLNINALLPGAVVDKASARQVMEGTPGEQVVSTSGEWVYTVYRNADYGPFVHALNVTNQYAMCIDLPKAGKEDSAAADLWGLVLSPNGQTLYAVNGMLGQAVEIGAGDQSIRRTIAFPPQAAAPAGPLARLGSWLAPSTAAKGRVLHSAALASDGRTLYVLGNRGVLVLDTGTLSVRQRLAPEAAFVSLAVSPDGARLYVATEGLAVQRRDAATGAVLGEFGGGGILRVTGQR
jgi:DNA-binding beta-propeller fold protein YncE